MKTGRGSYSRKWRMNNDAGFFAFMRYLNEKGTVWHDQWTIHARKNGLIEERRQYMVQIVAQWWNTMIDAEEKLWPESWPRGNEFANLFNLIGERGIAKHIKPLNISSHQNDFVPSRWIRLVLDMDARQHGTQSPANGIHTAIEGVGIGHYRRDHSWPVQPSPNHQVISLPFMLLSLKNSIRTIE